jgi:hypothetical protein
MLDIQGDPIFMQSLSMIVQEGNTKEELETWALRAQERIRNNLRLKEDLLIAEIHVAGQPQAKINVVQSVSRGFWDEYEKKYMKNVLAIPGKMLVFVPENEAHLVFSRAQPIQYKKQNLGYYCINVVFNQNRITQILKQNMPDASRQAVFFDEEGAILSRTSALFDGMSAVDLGVLEPGRGINTNATGQWTYQTRYPAYFSKQFKKRMGVNYNDFVTDLRMKKAQRLLHLGWYSVAEVAGMVGYKSQRHFSRLFKAHMGCYPSELPHK